MDASGRPQANLYRTLRARLKDHPLSRVGPGLITGVADDDPSGIATYSQAGAQFGLDMLWTMPLAFPLMAAIQSMCANMGRVTGKGLAANIKDVFPPIVLRGVVLLLLVANTLNIAADVAAMDTAAPDQRLRHRACRRAHSVRHGPGSGIGHRSRVLPRRIHRVPLRPSRAVPHRREGHAHCAARYARLLADRRVQGDPVAPS